MCGKRKMTWIVCLAILMLLAGCGGNPGLEAVKQSLEPLPAINIPTAPELHTKKLLNGKGEPAGLLFPPESAFAQRQYDNDLLEAAQLGSSNTKTANKIFEILRAPAKKWWQFWK